MPDLNVVIQGTGSPEGVVTAFPGQRYFDYTNNNLWLKEQGDGSTGWVTPGAAATTPVAICVALGDEATALTAGVAKVTIRSPYAFTLTSVKSSVNTAPTDATLIVDINEAGVTLLSTKLSIDATEKTSATAAVPVVISDAAIADDAEISFDIDQIGSGVAGAGLKVWLIGTKP
jgi:hypothetical protein